HRDDVQLLGGTGVGFSALDVDDALAVERPGRLARVAFAIRKAALVVAVGVHDEYLKIPAVALRLEGDQRAVGRPGGESAVGLGVGGEFHRVGGLVVEADVDAGHSRFMVDGCLQNYAAAVRRPGVGALDDHVVGRLHLAAAVG